MRPTFLPLLFWFLVIVALIGLVGQVRAEPVAQVETGGVRIVLHTDECALKGIANLPRRATYHEGGKTFEGCVGLSQELQLFMFYFEDRTVVAVPASFFTRITGA